MLKALQKSYPNASAIHIQHKALRYPRIVIKVDLSIFIRVPLTFSQEQIQSFIAAHHQWIESSLKKLHNHRTHCENTLLNHPYQIPIFGTWCDIKSIINRTRSLFSAKNTYSQILYTYLMQSLSDYIYPRTAYYAARMGLNYRSIKITNAISRFGSCSYDNRLFFSFMLIFAQKTLIDYVIIHELTHIVHKNHSKDFWNLLTHHCKNAKSLRQLLRKEAKIYPALLAQISSLKELE